MTWPEKEIPLSKPSDSTLRNVSELVLVSEADEDRPRHRQQYVKW